MEENTWLLPIVVVPKKNGKFRICVNFIKLNVATKKDSCPLPFIDEVSNIIVKHDAYSFFDEYFGYHQIFITLEDMYKATFVTNWGVFIWGMMPFEMKNGLPIYEKVVSRAFRNYLDKLMKIFLDDFTIYNDMDTHLDKFTPCF
jgi:hypothetical protein